MIVFLNGKFVPEAEATVSVFDRSFLYGDGLFETIRVCNGKPFRLQPHLARLDQGAKFLGITVPHSAADLSASVAELIVRNSVCEALLRITLSRGVGVRGYSPKGADQPTLVMSVHPFESHASGLVRWRTHVSGVRLPAGDALAQFKSCNKLMQVLARAEADAAGANEALLVNTDGFVVEAASGNLFWVQAGRVCTPPLADGVLRGITRGVVLELCQRLDVPAQEMNVRLDELHKMESVFLSLSSFGIVEVSHINDASVNRSPIVTKLFQTYSELLRAECA